MSANIINRIEMTAVLKKDKIKFSYTSHKFQKVVGLSQIFASLCSKTYLELQLRQREIVAVCLVLMVPGWYMFLATLSECKLNPSDG